MDRGNPIATPPIRHHAIRTHHAIPHHHTTVGLSDTSLPLWWFLASHKTRIERRLLERHVLQPSAYPRAEMLIRNLSIERRPREGYISELVHRIKRMVQDLYRYARRHPARVVMLLLPLITGGALAGILKQFGIR